MCSVFKFPPKCGWSAGPSASSSCWMTCEVGMTSKSSWRKSSVVCSSQSRLHHWCWSVHADPKLSIHSTIFRIKDGQRSEMFRVWFIYLDLCKLYHVDVTEWMKADSVHTLYMWKEWRKRKSHLMGFFFFTGENLAFWEAAEELKWGTASSMLAKAESIFK